MTTPDQVHTLRSFANSIIKSPTKGQVLILRRALQHLEDLGYECGPPLRQPMGKPAKTLTPEQVSIIKRFWHYWDTPQRSTWGHFQRSMKIAIKTASAPE